MQFGGAATIEGNLVLGKEYTQDNIDAAGKNWGSYTLSDGGACELSGGSLLVKGSEYIATDSSAPSSFTQSGGTHTVLGDLSQADFRPWRPADGVV